MENKDYQGENDTETAKRPNPDIKLFFDSIIGILMSITVAVGHEKIILPFLDPILGMLAIRYSSVALSFSLLLGTSFIISSVLFYAYSRNASKLIFTGFFAVIVWFLYSVLSWRVIG